MLMEQAEALFRYGELGAGRGIGQPPSCGSRLRLDRFESRPQELLAH